MKRERIECKTYLSNRNIVRVYISVLGDRPRSITDSQRRLRPLT